MDFQRIEAGKVVFELPTNPLVVPQMCLRFNDIPSVGVSGKHGTSFCMIGQTAIANKQGYWKDKCIDLDFELLTKEFGIPEQEVSFVESVWVGRRGVRLLPRVLRQGRWSWGTPSSLPTRATRRTTPRSARRSSTWGLGSRGSPG